MRKFLTSLGAVAMILILTAQRCSVASAGSPCVVDSSNPALSFASLSVDGTAVVDKCTVRIGSYYNMTSTFQLRTPYAGQFLYFTGNNCSQIYPPPPNGGPVIGGDLLALSCRTDGFFASGTVTIGLSKIYSATIITTN
jgi:hypothetical protein